MTRPDRVVLESTDIFGDQVVLRECTLEYHRQEKSAKDYDTRLLVAEHMVSVLQRPRLVYRDPANVKTRARYIDLIADQRVSSRVKALVVVVDIERRPKEVVTWLVKRSLSSEDFSGGLLYAKSEANS